MKFDKIINITLKKVFEILKIFSGFGLATLNIPYMLGILVDFARFQCPISIVTKSNSNPRAVIA